MPNPCRACSIIATSLILIMLSICQPAVGMDLQEGIYIVSRIEASPTITDKQERAAATAMLPELREQVKTAWFVIDTESRRVQAFSADRDKPQTGELSENLDRMTDPNGVSMSVEVIDDKHFASEFSALHDFRATYRRVAPDSPEMAAIREARQEALVRRAEARREAKEHLLALANTKVPLDVRQSLPGAEASFAMPMRYRIERDAQLSSGNFRDRTRILVVPPDEMETYSGKLETQWQRRSSTYPVTVMLDEDTQIGRDHFDKYVLLARTVHDGQTIYMSGETPEAESFSELMAIWRSIDAPVERMTPLRKPEPPLPDKVIGKERFDPQLDKAFANLTQPGSLLKVRQFGTANSREFFPERIQLEDDEFSGMKLIVEILEGAPDDVLRDLASGATVDGATTIAFAEDSCRLYAAFDTDLGQPDRPFSLALKQDKPGNYRECLELSAALESYDLSRRFSAAAAPGLLEHFARYRYTTQWSPDRIKLSVDEMTGVMNDAGKIVLKPEYDSVFWREDSGYELRKGDREGFASLDGNIVVPVEQDNVDVRDKIVLATRDGQESLYSIDGDRLLPPEFDDIAFSGDRVVVQKDGVSALFDPGQRRFIIPLSAGFKSFDRLEDGRRIRATGDAVAGLYDANGTTLIENAVSIQKRGPGILSVKMQKDGTFRFYDMDGELLSETEYESTWTHWDDDRIYVVDTKGGKYYIDYDLNRRTPEGYEAVYSQTEGGFGVVRTDVMRTGELPPRYGMGGPDNEMVLPAEYLNMFPAREGLIAAQTMDGHWGLWDKRGEQVLAPDWQAMQQSFDGRLFARRDDLWRLIDKSGKALDERRWQEIKFQFACGDSSFAGAKIHPDAGRGDIAADPAWEILDMQGNRLVEGTFTSLRPTRCGFTLTRDGKTMTYPDDFGRK